MAEYPVEVTCATSIDRLGGGGGTLGERPTDADRLPQPLGRSVGIGRECRSQFRSRFRGTAFWSNRRCSVESFGLFGRDRPLGSCHLRLALRLGTDRVHLHQGQRQRHAVNHRCDDRLCGECYHWCVEVLQRGGGYSGLRDLGIGQFCPGIWRPDVALRDPHGYVDPTLLPVDQDDEPIAVR